MVRASGDFARGAPVRFEKPLGSAGFLGRASKRNRTRDLRVSAPIAPRRRVVSAADCCGSEWGLRLDIARADERAQLEARAKGEVRSVSSYVVKLIVGGLARR